MPQYRVHILDRRGKLLGAVDLDCTDDENAEARVNGVLAGYSGELWRLVVGWGPDGPSSQPSHDELLTSGRRRRSY
jgi:hypothetical protein